MTTLAFGATEGILQSDSGSALTINSSITGTNTLTFGGITTNGGSGSITLPTANSYRNSTVAAQTISATGATAGAFTVTFDGATSAIINFNATAANVLAALQALPTIGNGNVSVTGGPLNTAPITVSFIGALAGTAVPVLTSTTTTAFAGGTLAIANSQAGVNSTTLNGGTLILGANNALGTGGLLVSGGTIQSNTTALNVPNYVTFNSQNAALALSGSSPIVLSGPMQLSGGSTNLTVANTGGTLISGSIGGSGVLDVLAPSVGTQTTLSLSGNNNYTGQTNVQAGVLNIQSNNALGLNPNNNTPLGTAQSGTFVASGATLQLQGGITITENITFGGGATTALENLSGSNTITNNTTIGSVTLAGSTTVIANDTGTLTIWAQADLPAPPT